MILRNFTISSTDTISNIFVKISAMVDSLPKYIYLKGVDLDIQKLRRTKVLKDVEIVNIFDIIKEGNQSVADFVKNLKSVIDLFPKLDKVNDIIKPWMVYNLKDLDQEEFSLISFSIVDTINKSLNSNYEVEFTNFEESGKLIRRDIEGKIKENKRLAEILVSSEVQIQGKAFTPFSLEKIKYVLEIGQTTDTTINEVFNSIVLNTKIPFASMGGYFKVLKDFIPDREWIFDTDPNVISLKLIKSGNEYEDVKFKFENGIFKITLEADTEKVSKEAVVETVLSVIKKSNPVVTRDEPISVKGVFYIPDQNLDKYVFAHLVMNDPSFSVLVIDEVGKATKEKNSIYSYYNTGIYQMSIVLTPKIMDRFDPSMKGQSSILFPEGSSYLRFRVSMKGERDAIEMQENISKLVALYNIRYQDVVNLYRKYIPSFPEVKASKKAVKAAKKKTGESRRCQHFPIIVTEDEAVNYSDYMKFPAEDGQIYTCETEKLGKFKYVGLQYRKETGEFSPCCFEINQKTKKNSNYNKYLKVLETGNKDILEQKVKQQRLITTKKYVDNGNFGDVFYPNVLKFFEMCDSSVKYFRLGVHRSKMSFLNCIMEVAREPGAPVISVDDVRSKLEELAGNNSMLSLCRQELPDKTSEEIREMLLSPDTYIDPKLFVRMVETEFKCKIFIFSENGMVVPRHFKNYLRYENIYTKVVTVIEHMGSESQDAKYPQCELIVYSKEGETTYYYQPSQAVSTYAEEIFSEMTSSYILGNKVEKYVIDLDNIVGQTIDSYGKVSSFLINHPKGIFRVYTAYPMPPGNFPEDVTPTYIPTINDISSLFSNFKFVARNGISNCVLVTLENKYYIQITNTSTTHSVEQDVVIPETSEDSGLRTFNMYKTLARYMTEYMIHAFSGYINSNNLPLSSDSIEAFVKTSVKVDPDVVYGAISKKFTSGTILRDGKIVLPSVEILKRLVYTLRLEISRNPNGVLSYYKRTNIDAYILDITDFAYVPTQVILYGSDTVQRYIYELNNYHTFNYNVGFTGPKPFFYKNIHIDNNKAFLAQGVDNIEDAKSIVHNWNKSGINISHGIQKLKLKLYKYENDSVVSLIQKGKGCVLGYKVNHKPNFTVLLDMEKIEYGEEVSSVSDGMEFLEQLLLKYSRANVVFPSQLYVSGMEKDKAVAWLRGEIQELARNAARQDRRDNITKADILRVLNIDDELNKIFELVGEKVEVDPEFKPRHVDIY